MNKYLTLALCFLCCLSLSAQIKIEPSQDWHLTYENEQIQLLAQYEDCEIPQEGYYQQYILLKFINKSDEAIKVSWFNDTYYPNTGCSNCDHERSDRMRTITLAAKSSQEGVCGLGPNVGLKVFTKFLRMENRRVLEQLIITDLKISNLN